MSEREQLLRAIAANYAEDDPRLRYADWLQENGEDDRAEFIRVQCESSAMGLKVRLVSRDRARFIHARADPLLAKHRKEWERLECPECGGLGAQKPPAHSRGTTRNRATCSACCATGNLLDGRKVAFTRGFISSVECRLGEVFTPDGKPTAWARAVVERLPIERMVLTCRTPLDRSEQSEFGWLKASHLLAHGGSRHVITDELWDHLQGGDLPPAEKAEREARIAKYAARAASQAPLFAGVVWRPRFGMTFAEVG